MGLWMKCPGCHTTNPLSLQVCPQCGRSLNNLPPAERVYVISPAVESAPAAQPVTRPQTAVPAAAPAASQPAKQSKKTRRKKK